MPKQPLGNPSQWKQSDRLATGQVCSVLGIHRSTLGRLAVNGLLAPDGETGGGRKYWLRGKVDAYRLGNMTTATVSIINSDLLPALRLSMPHGYRILGQTVIPIPLSGATAVAALASLLAFLGAGKTTAIALPADNHTHFIHQTVVDACREQGVPVILYPGLPL